MVTSASATILASGVAKVFLDLVNNSSTQTVCVNIGGNATLSGTACASGEITLPPLFHRSWEGSYIPLDAISALSTTATAAAFAVGAK
jgi:hypothetical protein